MGGCPSLLFKEGPNLLFVKHDGICSLLLHDGRRFSSSFLMGEDQAARFHNAKWHSDIVVINFMRPSGLPFHMPSGIPCMMPSGIQLNMVINFIMSDDILLILVTKW